MKKIDDQFKKGLLSKQEIFSLLNDNNSVVQKFALSIIREKHALNDLDVLIEKLEDQICNFDILEIIYEIITENESEIKSSQKDRIRDVLKIKLFDINFDEFTRVCMIKTLSSFIEIQDLNLFRELVKDSSPKMRLNAIKALGKLEDTETIRNSLNDKDEIRLECLKYLIITNYRGLEKIVEREFLRGSYSLKREIIKLIGDKVWVPGIDILNEAIHHKDLQELAASALGQMNSNKPALDILLKENEEILTKIENIDIFDRKISPGYISTLIKATTRFNDQKIIPLIERYLQTEYSPCFRDILERLSKFRYGFDPELPGILLDLVRTDSTAWSDHIFEEMIDFTFKIISKIKNEKYIEELISLCNNCGPEMNKIKISDKKKSRIQQHVIRAIAEYTKSVAKDALSKIDKKSLYKKVENELIETLENLKRKKIEDFF